MENTGNDGLWDEDDKSENAVEKSGFKGKNDKEIQNMFTESQVDTLHNLIYGKTSEDSETRGESDFATLRPLDYDTFRFDTNPGKLEIYS